jgi:hydrogenase maturation protease
MSDPRVLIACIGNIFLGDDGFGVEVARHLAGRTLPAGVAARDFGIRGLDLTYAMLDPYELLILVDACQRGGQPGTIYVIEPDPSECDSVAAGWEPHAMNPLSVLRAVREMGGALGRIVIVGCEPVDFGGEEGRLGLSEPVAAAVEEAVRTIDSLLAGVPHPQVVATGLERELKTSAVNHL